MQHLVKQTGASDFQGSTGFPIRGGLFGGNDVCRVSTVGSAGSSALQGADAPEEAVARYTNKVDKILTLSDKISKSDASALSSAPDIFELNKRIKKLMSCMEPKVFDVMPKNLKDIMGGSSDTQSAPKQYSLEHLEFKVLADLVKGAQNMEGKALFPKKGSCGLNLKALEEDGESLLTPDVDDPEGKSFYMKLYGCEKADALVYQESLSMRQKWISKKFMAMQEILVAAAAKPDEAKERIESELADAEAMEQSAEKEVQAKVDASSHLQTNVDANSLVEAESDVFMEPFTVFLILIVIFLILLFLLGSLLDTLNR